MSLANFQKIIRQARQTYLKNSQAYDKYLFDSNVKYDLQEVSGLNNNFNAQEDFSRETLRNYDYNSENKENLSEEEYCRLPQKNFRPSSQRIELVGDANSLPGAINIKNMITPEALDGSSEFKKEEERKKKQKSHVLAKIPDNLIKKSATDWEPINYRNVDDSYILWEESSAHIVFDEEAQKIIYHVNEPELNDVEKQMLKELKVAFVYVFEKVSPDQFNDEEGGIIEKGVKNLSERYKIKLEGESYKKIIYYLKRDFLGLELIEPLMYDPFIEDISCDGLNVPIFVNHLKYGPIEVNRKYHDGDLLNSFIIKLAQKSNQEISLSKPILQGALPDGSRIEAIYGKEVSGKGSSFTIRKFRAEPFTPIHLMEFGTMPSFLLAYLWLSVENKQSILVSGGTATGKTTILNALSLFVPPSSKIVSIEDTPEINLPHEHWLQMIARESEGRAEVSMFDLLKASLRERPEYIIVGEIRGAEASILFQGMATGHAGLGTVHAEKFTDLVNRMTIAPINLPKQLLTEVSIVIFMKQTKVKSNMVRRAASVVEVLDYTPSTDTYDTNEFVQYSPATDEFSFNETSGVMSNLLKLRGGTEESLWREIEKRRRILDAMHKNKLLEFKDVSEIIKAYYKDPSSVFEFIEQRKHEE